MSEAGDNERFLSLVDITCFELLFRIRPEATTSIYIMILKPNRNKIVCSSLRLRKQKLNQ